MLLLESDFSWDKPQSHRASDSQDDSTCKYLPRPDSARPRPTGTSIAGLAAAYSETGGPLTRSVWALRVWGFRLQRWLANLPGLLRR